MGKRVNYGFEKRQRELKKQKKAEEKAERRRLEAEAQAGPDPSEAPGQEAADDESPGA
ncbi:MAG: hypothetical protein OEN56_10945 [Gemmatimonadota bacterium]|nr:hypothetical protein [Gemmatimonadota bacterium]